MHYATVNPFTGQTLKTFDFATDAQIDAALATAHDTFLAWRETSLESRAALLQRAADLLRKDARRYTEILTMEMGKIIGEAEAEVVM